MIHNPYGNSFPNITLLEKKIIELLNPATKHLSISAISMPLGANELRIPFSGNGAILVSMNDFKFENTQNTFKTINQSLVYLTFDLVLIHKSTKNDDCYAALSVIIDALNGKSLIDNNTTGNIIPLSGNYVGVTTKDNHWVYHLLFEVRFFLGAK